MSFSKFLTDLLPRTGRMIRESGDAFNEADAMSFSQEYSSIYQAVANGATGNIILVVWELDAADLP